MTADFADKVRAICLALPEVTERASLGAPTWFVRGKNSFVTVWADGHHNNEFPHLRCASAPAVQQELIAADPAKFFPSAVCRRPRLDRRPPRRRRGLVRDRRAMPGRLSRHGSGPPDRPAQRL